MLTWGQKALPAIKAKQFQQELDLPDFWYLQQATSWKPSSVSCLCATESTTSHCKFVKRNAVDSPCCTALNTCWRGLTVISISKYILHASVCSAQRTPALLCSSRWPAQAVNFSKCSNLQNSDLSAEEPAHLLRLVPDGIFCSGKKLPVALTTSCLSDAEAVPIKHPVAASDGFWLSL